MAPTRHWIIMATLCLSAATIYLLPYSTEVFYKPLQEGLGLTNAQIGWLMSTLGVVNMLGYFPGGWLADRFSPRVLLSFSLVATGVTGLYFATFPPFWQCRIIYVIWSLTSIMTFWSALIKVTRGWAGPDEQGRAFGILEGGRGLVRLALSSLGVAVLGWFAGTTAGFRAVVILYASLDILLGALVWWLLRDGFDHPQSEASEQEGETVEPGKKPRVGVWDVIAVLRMPATWMITAVIFSTYGLYLASFYFTPFATDVFGMSVVMAGLLGAGKMIARPVGAVSAGFLGDRVGAAPVIVVGFIVALVSYGAFAFMPSYSTQLRNQDVRDSAALAARLADPDGPVAEYISSKLSEDTRDTLTSGDLSKEDHSLLVGQVNRVITREEIYHGERFAHIELRAITREYLPPESKEALGERTGVERARTGRLLLEDAWPDLIERLPEGHVRRGPPIFMLVLFVGNVLLATLCLYALRGLYYAMLEEGRVPPALTGTTTGVVSVLGYTPDIFLPPLVGTLLDRFPGGEGYRYVYGLVSVLCLLGLFASLMFSRRYTRSKRA